MPRRISATSDGEKVEAASAALSAEPDDARRASRLTAWVSADRASGGITGPGTTDGTVEATGTAVATAVGTLTGAEATGIDALVGTGMLRVLARTNPPIEPARRPIARPADARTEAFESGTPR